MRKYVFLGVLGFVLASCEILKAQSDTVSLEKQPQSTPVMGWSSWNTYRININSNLIKKQAKVAVDLGLRDVGYNYINTDDGFFGYRDTEGNLKTHPTRFPDGLKDMVDYINSLGMNAGIYSDAGANTCGSIWDKDPNGINVGLYGHVKQDAEYFFNKLGFKFIKIDYCGAGQELNLNEQKQYTAICDTIRMVANNPININICRWAFPGVWVRKIAQSWRISEDIAPKWWSIKYIVGKNLYLSAYAGGGHFNDMDMLEIGVGLPKNEEEVHFGLWCIMSSPLLIGCDLSKIPTSSLSLLKNTELIALNQDPLGLQAYVAQYDGKGYVLVKDIEKLKSQKRAVAFYNPTDTTISISVDMKALDFASDKDVKVRNLIDRQDEDNVKDTMTRELAPRSVRIYTLEGDRASDDNTRYEAEWSYLPEFNDLPKPAKTKNVGYFSDSLASNRMVVRYAGGREGNTIDWNNIYSANGGMYSLSIHFSADKFRSIGIMVNGKDYGVTNINAKEKGNSFEDFNLYNIPLNKGYNKVQLYSVLRWLPDIDYIRVIKQTETREE